MKVLDVGCGVGGPARNIARFSGANVTGVTLCEYQVARATAKTASEGLSGQVDFKKADFMKLDQTIAPGTYDAAYAIEATCHAPDRTQCFTQVFKALKPGAVFGGYEWVSTPNYDPSDPEQRAIMSNIEVGNGLPTIKPPSDVVDALKAAGFEVELVKDLAPTAQVPWYQPFLEPLSMKGFGASRHGIAITRAFVLLLEALGLAKKGTAQMHYNLTLGACDVT
jgi:sterol 24-C-methyltransferase